MPKIVEPATFYWLWFHYSFQVQCYNMDLKVKAASENLEKVMNEHRIYWERYEQYHRVKERYKKSRVNKKLYLIQFILIFLLRIIFNKELYDK